MNRQALETYLNELPLYLYAYISPNELEYAQRIRWICEHDCPMYGKSWACPPGVGEVSACEKKCKSYQNCLLISTITEVSDIANIEETLSTRSDHEEITNEVCHYLQAQGLDPYVLSTEACAVCDRCAILDGLPCRKPERMHPCVESHGINLLPTLEDLGIPFQYGENVVTWFSLLFFNE